MKCCSYLLGLFFAGIMIGCGGAPTQVEIPESEDTAAATELTDEEASMEESANEDTPD